MWSLNSPLSDWNTFKNVTVYEHILRWIRQLSLQRLERFHRRGQQLHNFIGTKESFYTGKTFNFHNTIFGTPTWPPFHCFGTPKWPPWRHVKTLYKLASRQYLSLFKIQLVINYNWANKSASYSRNLNLKFSSGKQTLQGKNQRFVQRERLELKGCFPFTLKPHLNPPQRSPNISYQISKYLILWWSLY